MRKTLFRIDIVSDVGLSKIEEFGRSGGLLLDYIRADAIYLD
jgi:hypothetical protein